MRSRGITAAALVVLAAACTERSVRNDRSVVTREDSAGIERVHNARQGESEPQVGVREVVRIGVEAGDEAYMLNQVYALTIDDSNRVFVGNSGTASVRVFGGDGKFIREFGRRGKGPAEFQGISEILLAGDSVVVIDWEVGGKTALFTKDGTLLRSWSLYPTDGKVRQLIA